MKIAFHTPFKPMDHPHPSGDLAIATGIRDFLISHGHQMEMAGRLRTRRIFEKPWLWPRVLTETCRLIHRMSRNRPRLWLTYHTYYKAPDVLGPYVSRRLRIPYVIFQGIHSTKRRRKLRTWPGFKLNLTALKSARHIFTNKQEDLKNLRRLIPEDRLTYIAPGIFPRDFCRTASARAELRKSWGVGTDPVILSAAMFRPGVKTDGLAIVIRACHRLKEQGRKIRLVIAGDGEGRHALMRLANTLLPGQVRFLGGVPRCDMYRYYSAADIFAFPGIRESLGMVFLEAQSCGLPVVAYDNSGVPEVVRANETGLLVPLGDERGYAQALDALLGDIDLRNRMGLAAGRHVRDHHNLNMNYRSLESVLVRIDQTNEY